MRRLFTIILVLALLWSGYWAAGAVAIDRGLSFWLDERRAEGWLAEVAEVRTTGYPGTFIAEFAGVELADPGTGLAWSAPTFRVEAASAWPTRVTAIWPEIQSLSSPFERLTIEADRMEGTVEVEPSALAALVASDIRMNGVEIRSTDGWSSRLTLGTLTTVQTETDALAHDILFEAVNVEPSEPLRAMIDPARLMPPVIDVLSIDATIGFDAPWDRHAIERARPQPRKLDLGLMRATWGQADLRAAGDLTIDGNGVATGRITVKAQNWREMLALGQAAGLVPEAVAPTIEAALEVLAGLSGNPQTIDAPLSFQNGFVSFGPVPLGPAPRFVIR
ncbi:MAG: DUF2125 domain-containing protein [Pseudomonadota bacterium]